MYKQIGKLDEIYANLEQAQSLITAVGDYFEPAKPDPAMLLVRYEMYGSINVTALGIVNEQAKELKKVVDELLAIRNGLRGAIV